MSDYSERKTTAATAPITMTFKDAAALAVDTAEVKRKLAEQRADRYQKAFEIMLKCHGCGCESITDGGWTCPAHEALRIRSDSSVTKGSTK